MNDKPETKIGYISPLKRICMTIGELPTSYLETMSYYEMLVWFVEFLKNQVIPVVNNNSEATEELQHLFIELQSYVNNYFDNLDVQEEINNKLDEMLEDGTLQEIIAEYLNSKAIFGFDSVANMKEATNLIDGSYAETMGFYEVNDGGNALYRIREIENDDIVDEAILISLHDNLVGELINENKNVLCFGAKKNDNTFDSSIAINKAIIFNKGGEIYIPSGNYYINSPIETYFSKNNFTNIKMDTNTKIIANNTMDYILNIGGISESYSYEVGNKKYITGGILETNNNVTISAINIYKHVKDLELSNVQIYYENCDGIICGDSTDRTSQDLYIHHCILNHKYEINTNNGILIHSNDNSFSNCRVYFNNKAININGGGIYFEDIHTLSNNLQTDNVGFYVQRGASFLNNCYCDSEDTCFKIYNDDTSIAPRLYISNFEYYSYRTNQLTFIDMTHNICRTKINNLFISCKQNENLHKGIVCSYERLLTILTSDFLTCDGLYIENDEYMRNGDILKGLSSDEKGKTIFRNATTNMLQNTWYLLGYFPANASIWNNFEITISNRTTKIPLSLRANINGQIRQDIGTGTLITDDTATYQLGAKVENPDFNSSNDYPVVGLYIRETSTHGRIINDYKMISNNIPTISLAKNIFSRELPTSTETMDAIYNLDCPNKTLSISS